ncbi:MAG: hypothetical protein RLY16_2163, partial [Bacteroidota bacterium]
VIGYETESGTKGRIQLPVEMWNNTAVIKAKLPVTEKLKFVTLDPDKVYPDYNFENNEWKAK